MFLIINLLAIIYLCGRVAYGISEIKNIIVYLIHIKL